jgi:serine/threonine protein phosphatase PrpC
MVGSEPDKSGRGDNPKGAHSTSQGEPLDASPKDSQGELSNSTAAEELTVARREAIEETRQDQGAELQVDWGAISHVGKVRANNEDHYLVYERRRNRRVLSTNLVDFAPRDGVDRVLVLAVADGLGGHAHGELASELALRAAVGDREGSWLVNLAELPVEWVPEHAVLEAERVHRRLLDEAVRDPQLRGMASTLTAFLVFGPRVVLIHIGDSRAYLWREGEFRLLSRDHTLAQNILRGQTTLPPRTARMASVLTNCLGGEEGHLRVDTSIQRWSPGDVLLLCTDGLSDLVSMDEIERVFVEGLPAQEACQRLVDRALQAGGRDNITVVIARNRGIALDG